MRLSVIADGISRDFEHALKTLTAAGLDHAELQFLWDKEVGDLSREQVARAKALLDGYGVKVPCISRHIFGHLSLAEAEIGGAAYESDLEALRRCIGMAQEVGSPLVRVMSFKREMILFGENGADHWLVAHGAWDKLVELMAPAVRIAEEERMTLVVETGNKAMITSALLARKLIDTLGTKRLKVLWDPANSLYSNENPFPDAWEHLKGGYLGHFHVKDAIADIPAATVKMRALGKGQMAPALRPIADALRAESWDGAISYESVYRPTGGTFEDGFLESVKAFKEIFGGN